MVVFKNEFEEKELSRSFYIWTVLTPLFQSAIIAGIIFFLFSPLPNQLPLFYSLPWGEKQLVSHQYFYLLPTIITTITIANLVISFQLHKTQLFFKKSILLSSLVSSLIFTITFLKIFFIFF